MLWLCSPLNSDIGDSFVFVAPLSLISKDIDRYKVTITIDYLKHMGDPWPQTLTDSAVGTCRGGRMGG